MPDYLHQGRLGGETVLLCARCSSPQNHGSLDHRRQLAEAGIRAEVKIHDKTELRDMARKGLRQAYLTDWGSSFFNPYDLVVPKLSTGAQSNFSFYSNPRVDELLALAGSSNDPLQREKAYREVQEILYDQSPWAFGYTLPRFEAESFAVRGYTPSLDGRINLHDVRLAEGDILAVDGARSFHMELNNALPPFNDIRLRKAVCLSIDWKGTGDSSRKPQRDQFALVSARTPDPGFWQTPSFDPSTQQSLPPTKLAPVCPSLPPSWCHNTMDLGTICRTIETKLILDPTHHT